MAPRTNLASLSPRVTASPYANQDRMWGEGLPTTEVIITHNLWTKVVGCFSNLLGSYITNFQLVAASLGRLGVRTEIQYKLFQRPLGFLNGNQLMDPVVVHHSSY